MDSGPRTRVDLCISLTITQIFYVARCRASENHIGNFRRTPALSAEGASGKLSTQGCRGKHRIQADGHSITYYNDSDSLLTRPRNKTNWTDAFVCRFVAAIRELIPHRHRRGDRPTLRSGAEFNCGLWFDRNSLLKVPPLHSASELVSLKTERCEGLRLCGLSTAFRWADTFFNYAHEGRELEA